MAESLVAARFEEEARKTLEHDVHYLTSVTQMAEVKEVLAREEIFAANGMKLVTKGVRVGSELRARLLNHILLKPIDHSLSVKDGVTAENLAEEAGRLLGDEPLLRGLLGGGEARGQIEAFARLELSEQFGFKLTVARSQQPLLFQHLLASALLSHSLANRLMLPVAKCEQALLAGLTHDLGELHTDPALLDRDHRIQDGELRYLSVHPITSYLIVKELVHSSPDVATAVLQHQEKLDGSGYPYGLRGDAIGQLARIVAIADACTSIVLRHGSSERLSSMMRLNRQKFDPTLIRILYSGLGHDFDGSIETLDVRHVEAAAALLRSWNNFCAEFDARKPATLAFLFERMATLRLMFVQFGLNPEDPKLLEDLAAERDIASEMAAAFDEVRWQIVDIEREIQRHRASIVLAADEERWFEAWLGNLRAYLDAVTPPNFAALMQ